ncbi:MAG: mycothiol system anti-sigma-R factor [Acidimicrobiales bacterium]|jgi:mycothiol system anti-sigma-R factor
MSLPQLEDSSTGQKKTPMTDQSRELPEDQFPSGQLPPLLITDCTDAFAQFSMYLDGALPRPYQQSVKTHIDECPPCLTAFQFQSQLSTQLKGMLQSGCQAELPSGMRDRVFGRVLGSGGLSGGLFGSDSGPTI